MGFEGNFDGTDDLTAMMFHRPADHPEAVMNSISDAEIEAEVARLRALTIYPDRVNEMPVAGYGRDIKTLADLIADVERKGHYGVGLILYARSKQTDAIRRGVSADAKDTL